MEAGRGGTLGWECYSELCNYGASFLSVHNSPIMNPYKKNLKIGITRIKFYE